ncbi:MAG: AtpZ/AtpI family protein [Candidatus Neomarinimicrobiota bacterium]
MPTDSDSSRNVLSATYTLTGALLGLGLLGYFLDRKLDTAPYLLLVGLLLGAAVGMYDLWKVMFPPRRNG